MPLQSQLLHDLERTVQGISGGLRQRKPDGLSITLEQPFDDARLWFVASDTRETERDQRVA